MVCQFPICAMIAALVRTDQLPGALPIDVEVLKNDHG